MGTYIDVLRIFGEPFVYNERAIAFNDNCLVRLPAVLAPDITNEAPQMGKIATDLFTHVRNFQIKKPILISLMNLQQDIEDFRNFNSIHKIIAPSCKFNFGHCLYDLNEMDMLVRAAELRNISTAVMLTNRPCKINLFMAGIIEFVFPACWKTEKKPEIINVPKMDNHKTGAKINRAIENCPV